MVVQAATLVDRGGDPQGDTGASNSDPQANDQKSGTGQAAKANASSSAPATGIWAFQRKAEDMYQDIRIQLFVASLIVTNFLTFMISKQIDPSEEEFADLWLYLDYFYNAVFFFELILNVYGTWFWRFWSSPWNVFDFMVVTIGLLDTAQVDLGPLRMLRMMRAFRVFRLFKKIDSLNKIIMSLMHAIPGMVNAFLINTIFMCIYAVLGVDFFGYVGEDCKLGNDAMGINKFEALQRTGRGNCFGQEYYGNFGKSLYTLFQVLTGDSWSEAVVRPILLFYGGRNDAISQMASACFFVSFILINAVILVNVVVAVLLEKMATLSEDEPEGPAKVEEAADGKEGAEGQIVNGEKDDAASIASCIKGMMEELGDLRKQARTEVQSTKSDMELLRRQVSAIQSALNANA
jgi:hypothetical protein